jgi:ABC-type transport system involved in multi-copper enzyme maturation permease subunit
MPILTILYRELTVAARRGRETWSRSIFAATLLVAVLGTFIAWFYWEEGHATNRMMSLIAQRSFFLVVGIHVMAILAALGQGARSIALEKDRQTLESLLTTPLASAEIVLGKFAAEMVVFAATMMAGLPLLILLNRLGGVDGRLILLAYLGLFSTGLFLVALATWASVRAKDSRRAAGFAALWTVAWLIVPFFTAFILPRLGIVLPRWLLTANAWLLASSPTGLLLKLPVAVAPQGVIEAISWMCGLQAVGGAVFLAAAILQLRSTFLAEAGGDAERSKAGGVLVKARFRSRPPIGDAPILWRERYTCRPRGFLRLANLLIYLAIAAAIAYPTWFYGWPALVEAAHHGYSSGATGAERPEFNLLTRFFGPAGPSPATDQMRIDFNIFLRFVTVSLAFFVGLAAAGAGAEAIATERARETWSSLIATPLSASDILRQKMLTSFWRFRLSFATLILLWTLGLLAGAIHPLGILLSLLGLCSSTWCLVGWGILCALRAKNSAAASNPALSLALMLLLGSAALPFFLPARFSTVLMGFGSPPFLLWLTQFSYRDLSNLWHYPAYPHLDWIGIYTKEGPLEVAATCLLGILAPALSGIVVWRYATAHFDRLVGRPWKAEESGGDLLVVEPAPLT